MEESLNKNFQEPTTGKKIGAFETRIHEIDFFRGALMCLVIIDHLFNLFLSYTHTWATSANIEPYYSMWQFFYFYWTSPIRAVVRYGVLGAFCFVSGLSSAFSRSNEKRAIEMLGIWAAVFLVSNLLELWYKSSGLNLGIAYFRVDFNILGVLAFSMLVYCLVQNKGWVWLLVIALVGFAAHIAVRTLFAADSAFGATVYCPFLWRPSGQADYVPLVPYISFFLLGALVQKFTYAKHKYSYFKRFEFERPICFLGRHSLIIYATHFLILMGVFALINAIFF